MDPIDFLFGFRGRINRAKYWLAVAIWFGVWIAVAILLIVSEFATAAVIVAVVMAIPSVYSGVAVGIKRLHNRNKSALWLLLFYLAPGVLDATGRGTGLIGKVFSLASLVISVWANVALGCLRGSIGGNPYGPDPVASKPAKH